MTGWEERPPGYGRPQGQINPMVDTCDVFIGLLRRKWGSHRNPRSGSGRSSSVRSNDGRPQEIAGDFAVLRPTLAGRDRGRRSELTRVLAFQERVKAERIGIYSKFTDPHHLGDQVEDLLERHLIDLVVSQSASGTPVGPESLPENTIDPGLETSRRRLHRRSEGRRTKPTVENTRHASGHLGRRRT